MSKLQKMEPKTPQEYEDFADTLGEHCQKFSDKLPYKDFVKNLIDALCESLPPEKITEIGNHVHRFQQTRSREEKSGDVQYHLRQAPADGDSEGDDDDLGQTNLYDDFM
ncbi:hypothetical protein M9Y10_012357 [Tritrichomonas musculus]|uniref:Eukaryotic translation initiation factor 3 30 kDa subunit n=1 Tax=Tritrichomonas musculus TaxID=1915356 RepID=A0ABR2ID32_9EUKA